MYASDYKEQLEKEYTQKPLGGNKYIVALSRNTCWILFKIYFVLISILWPRIFQNKLNIHYWNQFLGNFLFFKIQFQYYNDEVTGVWIRFNRCNKRCYPPIFWNNVDRTWFVFYQICCVSSCWLIVDDRNQGEI